MQTTDEARPDTWTPGPVAVPEGSTRLPPVVYVLALGTFLMLTTEFVVAGILPDVARDVHVSIARAGLVVTVFAVGMIVGAPVMTMLARGVAHRTTLVLALGVFAAGHVVVAASSQFGVLLGARFVTALATGAFWSVSTVVATEASGPALRTRAVSLVSAGGALATVIGVPIGAVVGQTVGWRSAFWGLAVLAVGTIFVIRRHVPRHGPDERAGSVRSQVAVLRSRRLWLTLAACAFTTGGVLATYSFITPLLTDHTGVRPGLVPLVLAGFGAGALVGTIVGGRLGDAHPHALVLVVPAVSALVSLALFASSESLPATVALVFLLGLFGLSANSVLVAFAVRFCGVVPTLGSSTGVAAFNLGTALGSAVASWTLHTGLGVTGPVLVGAVVVTLTLVPATALVVLERRRPTQRVLTAVAG